MDISNLSPQFNPLDDKLRNFHEIIIKVFWILETKLLYFSIRSILKLFNNLLNIHRFKIFFVKIVYNKPQNLIHHTFISQLIDF